MNKNSIDSTLIVSLLLAIFFFGFTGYGWISCKMKEQTTDLETRYVPFAGCLVQAEDSEWIPLENYRVIRSK